jgi:hypothetical protein
MVSVDDLLVWSVIERDLDRLRASLARLPEPGS